jgi:hypothetical protein
MKNRKMTDSVVLDFNKNKPYQFTYVPELLVDKEEPKRARKLNDASPEEWDKAFRDYYNAK